MEKKNLYLVMAGLIVVVTGIVGWLIYNGAGKSKVILLEDESFLNDFEVINDTVHIYCTVSLENKSSNSTEVKLVGDFAQEATGGLLEETTLEAHFMDSGADTITVAGNSELKYVQIEFVGTFAGTEQMSSRLLPEIEVVNVD